MICECDPRSFCESKWYTPTHWNKFFFVSAFRNWKGEEQTFMSSRFMLLFIVNFPTMLQCALRISSSGNGNLQFMGNLNFIFSILFDNNDGILPVDVACSRDVQT